MGKKMYLLVNAIWLRERERERERERQVLAMVYHRLQSSLIVTSGLCYRLAQHWFEMAQISRYCG